MITQEEHDYIRRTTGDQSFYQPTFRGNLETSKISSSELAYSKDWYMEGDI